ncbi:MAG TPA: hypothetical protein EYP52_07560 [Anaerolineae bacterium]|nr:hypothetical protein [Anaerolineae bacterium]
MGTRPTRNAWAIPVVLGVCLLMIFLLGRGISDQVERLERIRAAQAQLQSYIDQEQEYNRALQVELEEVTSPDFPEKWGRENLHWARPGEVVLSIPVPTPSPFP